MRNLVWMLKYRGKIKSFFWLQKKYSCIPWVCERIILCLLQVGLMLAALFQKISYLAHSAWARYLGKLGGFPTARLAPWRDPGKLQDIMLNEWACLNHMCFLVSRGSVTATWGYGNLRCQFMCSDWWQKFFFCLKHFFCLFAEMCL